MSEAGGHDDLHDSRLAVAVRSADPISRAGLAAQLRGRHELSVVDDVARALVAVVVCDAVDQAAVRALRAVLDEGARRVVVVATTLDDEAVLDVAEAGACAVLRRVDADPETIATVLLAASKGHGAVPSDLLGAVLSQVGRLRRSSGLVPGRAGTDVFTSREVEVLRLVADGFDTAAIARKLSYSERTVKSVIHEVTTRLGLRNRCHAVAYAVRAGLV